MIINLKSETDLSGFYIIYEGSTNLERPGIFGISHFSEHLFCKSYEHLRNTFEKKGIDWNAYTSNHVIVFYFTGLDEYLLPYKDEVVKLISNFIPTEEQFTNEKRIIIEEYKQYFSDQNYSHGLNLSRKIFGDYDAIGLLEDLENMNYQDMLDFIKIQYSNPSKIINVSRNSDYINPDIKFNLFINNRKINQYKTENCKFELGNDFNDKTSIIITSLPFKENFNYIKFITYMLSDGLESPLYQEVREKRGLTYGIYCDVNQICDEAFMDIKVQTSNDKVNELLQTIKLVIDNPDIYLTQERFDIVKEGLIIYYKKAKINQYNNINKYIEPENFNVENILQNLTLDKIKEIYNIYIKFDNMYISNDKTEFI